MDWTICEISGNYLASGSSHSYWIFDNDRRFYLSKVNAMLDEFSCGSYDTLALAQASAERIENVNAEQEA